MPIVIVRKETFSLSLSPSLSPFLSLSLSLSSLSLSLFLSFANMYQKNTEFLLRTTCELSATLYSKYLNVTLTIRVAKYINTRLFGKMLESVKVYDILVYSSSSTKMKLFPEMRIFPSVVLRHCTSLYGTSI